MIQNSTREYAIPLIFNFWIYITTVLVNSGCSEHLLKALSRVCSGQQVESSCIVQSQLLTTSADEPSIGKELAGIIAIIAKLPTINHTQDSDSAPRAPGVADRIPNDVANDSEVDGEDKSDDNSDLDDAFTISPAFISACASLSHYRSGNPVPTYTPQECALHSQSCSVVSPSALALVDPSSRNRHENDNSISLVQSRSSTRGKPQGLNLSR
jgi:hypothetical protein